MHQSALLRTNNELLHHRRRRVARAPHCSLNDDPLPRMGQPRLRRKGDTAGAASKAWRVLFAMRMCGILSAQLPHLSPSEVTLLLQELQSSHRALNFLNGVQFIWRPLCGSQPLGGRFMSPRLCRPVYCTGLMASTLSGSVILSLRTLFRVAHDCR